MIASSASKDSLTPKGLTRQTNTEQFKKLMMNYENTLNDQLTKLDNNIKKVNNMDHQSGGIFG